MKLVICVAALVVLQGCAAGPQPVPREPSTLQVVSGGRICLAEKTVRSRIRKVRCRDGNPRPATSLSSVRCTGDPGICARIENRDLLDEGRDD